MASTTPFLGLHLSDPLSDNFSLEYQNDNMDKIDKDLSLNIGSDPLFEPRIVGNSFYVPGGIGKGLTGTGSNLQLWGRYVGFEAQILLKKTTITATTSYNVGSLAPQFIPPRSVKWHTVGDCDIYAEGWINSAGVINMRSIFGRRNFPISLPEDSFLIVHASYNLNK